MKIQRRNLLRGSLSAPAILRAQPGSRPNILYLHSHDTGRYIQPYGHPVPTPHLQRFAEQATLFRQAFDAAPTCSPSRAALLTGMAPHSCGMYGLAHRGFALNDKTRHLANYLRSHGYLTALAGVQHEARAAEVPELGYQEILAKGTRAPEVSRAAMEFLERRHAGPFFLSAGFFETHRDFYPPTSLDDARYTLPPAPLPDTPEVRADMAAFRASARILDDAMGRILSALDRAGLAGNTIVICTTDHGVPFPHMKCNLTSHGTGVMLMMRGPGIRSGHVTDALVSQVDLFPTLCELTGLARPGWLQGQSLRPLLDGGAGEVREELFGEVSYHAAYEPARAVRTRRHLYIRRYGERQLPVLPNCDDGPSKSYLVERGWKNEPVAREELFDLVFDPNEARNVAGEARYRGALTEMRSRLDRWMRDTADPLLTGPVPAPKGAQVNDPNGISPREPVRVVD